MHPALKEVVDDIRRVFPASKPVKLVVTTTMLGPGCGYCEVFTQQDKVCEYVIHVRESRIVILMIETFIHEWAHVLDIDKNGIYRKHAHRASWGVQYAKLWQYFENNFGAK